MPAIQKIVTESPARALLDIADAVVGAVLTPFFGPEPTAPSAPVPPVWAAVEWLRREYEYSVLGEKLTIKPSETVASDTGTRLVQGTLDASGPNSDLTYKVTQQPADGTVTVDANGLWTFTPNADFSPIGGTDSFTVQITDTAFHLQNLFGAAHYTTTVTVPVTVQPQTVGSEPTGTQVFTVYNFTQNSLTLNYPTAPAVNLGYPIDGTVLAQGESVQFQIAAAPDSSAPQPFYANFVSSTGQTYSVGMVTAYELPGLSSATIAAMTCSASGGAGQCGSGGGAVTQMVLMDAPGTTVTIPAAKADLVNTILNNVCGAASATCTFDATSQTTGYGDAHAPTGYTVIQNNTQDNITNTVTWTDSVATQTSWSVSVDVSSSILDLVTAEITATYGKSITDTTQFSESTMVTIRPGYEALLSVEEPEYIYTGDFTVSVGNTTWDLPDATLEVGDTDGNPIAVATTQLIPATEVTST